MSGAEQSRLRAEAAAGKLVLPKDNRFEVQIQLRGRQDLFAAGQARLHRRAREQPDGHLRRARRAAEPGGRGAPRAVRARDPQGRQRPDAITVPQRSVMEGPQGKLVYVIGAEHKAEPRAHPVGEWAGENEWVVTLGPRRGREGDRRRAGEGVPRRAGAGQALRQVRPAPSPSPGKTEEVGDRHVLALLHRPPDLRGGALDLHRCSRALAAMRVLPIAQYPEISPPVVSVTARLPRRLGRRCSTSTVAAPHREAINGVEDMLYMQLRPRLRTGWCRSRSPSTSAPTSDQAAINVNNRVQAARVRAARRRCAARA